MELNLNVNESKVNLSLKTLLKHIKTLNPIVSRLGRSGQITYMLKFIPPPFESSRQKHHLGVPLK